jgi:uncharacterized protein (DUF2252 family)
MSKKNKPTEASTTLPSREHPQLTSPEQRRLKGKALRDAVPRESHSGWKAPKKRTDPIKLLKESNKGRIPALIPIRFGRMQQSPFAFYRGSASIMASDLSSTPASGIRVQACGDAHLCNFGAYASPEGQVVFDINDLDETLPAPWEWDIKRLVASVVIAGQHVDLTQTEAAQAATATARSYREHMADYAEMSALGLWNDTITLESIMDSIPDKKRRKSVERRLKKEREKSSSDYIFPKLAEASEGAHKIKDMPPLIYHPTVEEAPGIADNFQSALDIYRASLPHHTRVLFDRFTLCDMAMKVVGVGSVGTLCAIGLFMASDDDPLFLQIKEARASVLEPYAGKSIYKNHGQRVVEGQRLMQVAHDIFLGWTTGKVGRDAYFRQLRNIKMGPIIEGWNLELLSFFGELCGRALARAHARSGDAALIAGYLGSSPTFDDALCEFAVEYSDQNQRDYKAFLKAVQNGNLPTQTEGF